MQTYDCDSHKSEPSIWRSRRVLLAGDITMFIVYGEIAPSDVMSLGEERAYSKMRDDSLLFSCSRTTHSSFRVVHLQLRAANCPS